MGEAREGSGPPLPMGTLLSVRHAVRRGLWESTKDFLHLNLPRLWGECSGLFRPSPPCPLPGGLLFLWHREPCSPLCPRLDGM